MRNILAWIAFNFIFIYAVVHINLFLLLVIRPLLAFTISREQKKNHCFANSEGKNNVCSKKF